jgi:hypothetical protein
MSRIAVVVALAVALCVVGGAPATAHWRAPVKVHTIGSLTGPDTAAGAFTSRIGSIKDSGTYSETFSLVGDAITAVKFFTGRRGTFEMHMYGWLVFQTPTTATFRDGEWMFRNGTGTYEGLEGSGEPVVAKGSADLAAGTVDVIHRGTARALKTNHGHDRARHQGR